MQKNLEKQEQNHLWLSKYPTAVDWHAPLNGRAIPEILSKTCQDYADRPAFDFLGKKWCWQEIGDLVNKMTKGLQDLGVSKGKKVGLFLPNSPYFLISYYAVLQAGGTVVNFNPLYAEREIQHQIEDSETDIMITTDLKLVYDKLPQMLRDTRLDQLIVCPFADVLPFPKNVLFKFIKSNDIAKLSEPSRTTLYDDLINNDGSYTSVDIDPDNDIAVLQYTGGTTGTPKAAMLTHTNVSTNVDQCIMWFHKAEFGKEKMLGVLPFFHVFAMTGVMNMAVRCAFEIIALPKFELEEALKAIDKKKPHYFPAVPAIYSAINNSPKSKKYDLTSLRYCISGGAPLPVEVKKTFESNTGCIVVEGYGLSESSPVACVNPIVEENKAGSIGMPLPGTIVKNIDPDSNKLVENGKRGELCISGPQVMKGYWNKPEETKNTFTEDGYLRTGDIAIMDDEGYFFIVDRLKDMIITNGYNVYPRNVEEAIYLHPNVEECIVAGLPDKARGEIVKAWIKPKDGRKLTGEDLRSFLEDKISKMEIPRRIEVREEPLPKTMIGKLSRKDVIAQETSDKN